jgi:UDP-glucose 4-epimerase
LTDRSPIVNGTGRQIRCFTFVEDDVEATILIAEKNKTIGEIYNVAALTRLSVKELARLIIKKYGKRGLKIIYARPRQGENLRPVPDTRKIEKLGFRAGFSVEEGLEKTKRWIETDLRVKK